MTRKRLLWQLYPSYLLITLLALVAATWYATRALRNFYYAQVVEDLESRAHLSKHQLTQMLDENNWSRIDKFCKKLGPASNTRITVIHPDGRVMADSEENPITMDNHADRPEIIEALKTGKGQYMRFSDTLQQDMMYVAVTIIEQDNVIAVVRTSVPVTAINKALRRIYLQIGLGGLIIAIIAAGICLLISRRISRPIEQMTDGAQRFARGELETSVFVPASVELAALANSMNEMARQLYARIETVTQQRNELEAVLSSMVEGVLAVDSQGRIMSINETAARLFNIDPGTVKGQTIQGVIRNPRLQEFVEKTLKSDQVLEASIVLANDQDHFFSLHGTGLSDTSGHKYGAVIVLNDTTRLRQLENIRRDFVANVSHELKTPVTTIKGFVETLREGAFQEPKKAQRFLDILANQTNRLNAIIEDLLSLSRIEEESEKESILLEEVNIKPIVNAAIELSQVHAARKDITIESSCDDNITARVNPALLEQALINLIDNAIKYSAAGKNIRVLVKYDKNNVDIIVEDYGCGIPPKHLDRIFERFYVVDKARSRKLGGTGLGLAIVKHIAQSHGGAVSVDSTVGKGSRFTMQLRRV